MKKIGLFLFFIASLSMLSLNSCKKDDETADADKFVGSWVNSIDPAEIMVITKVNSNTISVMGIATFTVTGTTFTGTQTDPVDNTTSTITGVLVGNILTVNLVEKNSQGVIINNESLTYIKM